MSEMEELFNKERMEVLKTLDEVKLRNFFKKWNPSDELWQAPKEIFWRSIMLGILNIDDAPEELKNKARQWFDDRGEKVIEPKKEPEPPSPLILPPSYGKTNLPI